MPPRRKVVITGVGVVSPIGIGNEAFWQSLSAGQSGVHQLPHLARHGLPLAIGAEIRDFSPLPFVHQRKSLKVMCRDIQLSVAAASLARQQAKLEPNQIDPDRLGVDFGAHTMPSDLEDLTPAYRVCLNGDQFDFSRWGEHALDAMHPLWMLKYLPNMPACHVAIAHNARGPNNSITQNEVSSLLAISEAVRAIERNWADAMIAGGAGSRVLPKMLVNSSLCDSFSRRTSDPAAACRPFDADRDGLVNGEGAAAFILEEEQFAQSSGATILARVLGYGAGCEVRRTVAGKSIPLQGTGIEVSIAAALRDAGLTSADIGHVNAHGLSTQEDDRAEAQAIRRLLGSVPVTAPKSYFGNLGAGTGAVELAVSLLSLIHSSVPPTLNYHRPDPACPIHVLHTSPTANLPPIALSLNHCTAGQTAAIILGR